GVAFRAVVADCAYGDQDGFRGELTAGELTAAGLPFVLALKRRRGRVGLPGPGAHARGCRPSAGLGWPRRSRRLDRRLDSGAPHLPRPATGTPPPGGPPTPAWAGGARTRRPGWWWRPLTRPPCPSSRPGIWPPTCLDPAHPMRPTA